MKPSWDYGRWGEVWDYADLEAFVQRDAFGDGVHRINLPLGAPLELLISGGPLSDRSERAIAMFFSAAVTSRTGTSGPYFSGRRMASNLAAGFVAFADPLLANDADLGLAWYTGLPGSNVQEAIATIASHLCEVSGRRAVAIGGSGGGFAALELAHRVQTVSALVWNPQTRILAYSPTAVQRYLRVMFGREFSGSDWLLQAEVALAGAGLTYDLTALDSFARGFYIQNATDWHVQKHLAPYLDSRSLVCVGDGYYRDPHNPNFGIQIGDFAEGHAVPEQELLESAALVLLESGGSANGVHATLRAENWIGVGSQNRVPVDLRPIGGDVLDSLGLVASVEGADHHTSIRLNDDNSYPRLSFQFYAYGPMGRVANNFPQETTSWSHSTESQVDRVVCTVRDGFGHMLGQLTAEPERERTAPAVLIYGSCVSRDAFELDGAPPVGQYFARSSIASAFSGRPTGLGDIDLSQNPSAFQRRMVWADLNRSLVDSLRSSDESVMVVDFIDERFHLGRSDQGALFTISPELVRAGFDTADFEKVASGSPEHVAAFRAGWQALSALLPHDRIVINKVYWAFRDETGEPVGNPVRIKAANEVLDQFYSAVAELSPNVRWLQYERDSFVSDSNHKWGAAPFHFSSDFYQETLRQLRML